MTATSPYPGTILKIEAYDFVSYHKLMFSPAPTLNIFLAPNGAGKSSLLSAIILGLGGKPNVIGKSNQISDFIMYGKEESKICIHLSDPQSNNSILSVYRVIKRNCSTVWYLNNKKSNHNQVEEAMRRLNIQVDNLCQVLPQERVQDFAKMTSIQLLENIQIVLGNDLYKDYHAILLHRESLIKVKNDIEKNTRLHQDEIVKYQRLEKDVAAIEEKKLNVRSATLCRQKMAWTLYSLKDEEQKMVQGYLTEAQKKLADFEKELEPLKLELERIEAKCLSLNQTVHSKKKKVSSNEDHIRKSINDIKSSQNQIEIIMETLRKRREDAVRHKSLVEDLDVMIQDLAKQLKQENDRELTMQITEYERTIRQKAAELQSLNQQHNEIKQTQVATSNTVRVLETKLERAKDIGRKRLQMLASRNQDVFKGYQWLDGNRDKFQSNIYGPLLKELNVSNSEGAKYVEFIVPHRDLISFVTESSQDMTNLLRILKDKDKLSVNCAHCSPPTSDLHHLFPPRVSHEQIRKLGFDCYLIDLVEGPPTVIKHLCTLCKLHLIPVAFTQRNIDSDSVARHGISAYFIGKQFYRVKISRYSKKSSTSVITIRPSIFLADSLDKGLIQQTQLELNAKRESLQELETEICGVAEAKGSVEVDLNKLRTQKKVLTLRLEQYRNTTVRLRRHEEERTKHLSSMMFDQQKEEDNANSKIQKIVRTNIGKMKEISSYCKAYIDDMTAIKLFEIDISSVKKLKDTKKRELSNCQDSGNSITNNIEMLKKSLVEVRAEASNLMKKAKEQTEGLVMGEKEFMRRFAKSFATLPHDLDAITAKMRTFEAKARCLDNPLQEQHLKEYENAKAMAESLEVELAKLSDELATVGEKLVTLKSRWMPRVVETTTRLNDTFSNFFQKMGCVGEVSLQMNEDEEAIEKYGLEIKVKFRNNTDLQVLDQFVQSGGERALTTAVFLLSLQRLSNLPFRCVDEINQGMDQFNERRIYNLLFNTLSNVSSQYFLLTPKLLKKVSYPDKCTIFGIFNCYPESISASTCDNAALGSNDNDRQVQKRARHDADSNL